MATEVSFYNLDVWLQSQSVNTKNTPYEIKITDLTTSGSSSILYVAQILKANSTKYVDLSATTPPNGGNSWYGCFKNCTTLVKAPVIPNNVVDLEDCFYGCSNLIESPVLPANINNAPGTFDGCTSLTTVSTKQVYFGNTNHMEMFHNCSSLINFNCNNPYGLKTWLTEIKEESISNFPNNPNNCSYDLVKGIVAEISIYSLSDNLATLKVNTVLTPYRIKILNLTKNGFDIKSILLANNNKYVDLSDTYMPYEITDLSNAFENCTTLVYSPVLMLENRNGQNYASKCTFTGCVNLKLMPRLPNSARDVTEVFKNCTSMVINELISNSIKNMTSAFEGCSSITGNVNIPNSVIYMNKAFKGCTGLEGVDKIPNTVINLTECFYGCSSFEEIESFETSLNVLEDNAADCFYGCSSLTSIGIPVPTIEMADEWHFIELSFSETKVQGRIYDSEGEYVSIPETIIEKDKLTLPIMTDELLFSRTVTEQNLISVIENMLIYKYSYFNKTVIPPNDKAFIMYAKEPVNFVSNIPFGGNNGLPVGFVGAYYGTTDPDGWFICDGRDTTGTDIELETNFPMLYDFLGSNVLPDLRKRFIEGADNDVGTYVAPGIPNITGTTQHVQYMGGASGSGAFSRGDSSSNNSAYNGNTTKTQRLSFNAKSGETKTDGTLKGDNDTKVYGESDTVQPASLRLNFIIKAV